MSDDRIAVLRDELEATRRRAEAAEKERDEYFLQWQNLRLRGDKDSFTGRGKTILTGPFANVDAQDNRIEIDWKARAEAADKERDALRKSYPVDLDMDAALRRAEAAEKREAALRESIEKMLNGEIPLSTSIKAHFLAALEAKP